MELNSSRRKFIRTSAVAGAGALAGAAGVNALSPHIWPEQAVFEPNRSYWARSQETAGTPLDRDLETDVAIIGGGFTGLSAAYYIRLNQPGKRVAVLEARACGNGASGRNGAMVLTMTADRFMQFSSDPALDKRIYDLTSENINRLHALSSTTQIDCELDTTGVLQVFNTAADLEAGRIYVDKARNLGMPVELWDKQRTFNALGTDLYEGAFFDPHGGQVHPFKLVQAFKAAAQAVGAEIYESTPIASIEEGTTLRLQTVNGRVVKAKALVLASNAYTSKLGYYRNRIVPIFNFIGITAPLGAAELQKVGWRSRLPFSDSRTLVTYLGITRDNRIRIGGATAQYSFNDGVREPADATSAYQQLLRRLGEIFPSLSGFAFEATWSGVVDCSLDFSPSVGRLPGRENIYYGIGYSGHGVNLTSVFGRIIAGMIAEKDEMWKDLPFVNRHLPYIPNEPFRWLGVQSALAAYRMGG